MIGGQYLDTMAPAPTSRRVHRLKTGRLFYASVTVALWAAGVPAGEQAPVARVRARSSGCSSRPWTTSSTGTAMCRASGVDEARRVADEAADRARERLRAIPADTSVLEEIVAGLAVRTV